MPTHRNERGFHYAALADTIEAQIRNGAYNAGEKLPSIRNLHAETGLSISTVYQAFIELEKRDMVEARHKSGYFVKPLLKKILQAPQAPQAPIAPTKVTINNLASAMCISMVDPEVEQFGGALIAPELLPGKPLAALLKSLAANSLQTGLTTYAHYLGHFPLRRHIAQRLAHVTGSVAPDHIIITSGCIHAISLCLQAVARAGDTIVVESPTFPWFLQIIEDFGMYALEIPTTAEEGIDLSLLAKALERHDVSACIFNPTYNNPLGFVTPDDKKAELVALLTKKNIPIIEDDIYGELYFGATRPLPLKAFDKKGTVLYCASLSKTLSPGLRIGWTLPGRYLEKVQHLKLNHSIADPAISQMLAARYLQNGSFDRHLRKLRTHLKNQISNTALAVARYFPPGTKISAPQGGLTIWVQLPGPMDSLELFRQALAAGIAVLPGIICASTPVFNNCLRLSCGLPWSKKRDKALKTLAGLIRHLPIYPQDRVEGDCYVSV
jgi:DNA-binding transcriptional MocR family regulator